MTLVNRSTNLKRMAFYPRIAIEAICMQKVIGSGSTVRRKGNARVKVIQLELGVCHPLEFKPLPESDQVLPISPHGFDALQALQLVVLGQVVDGELVEVEGQIHG
jgi:hypothetical protein